MLRATGWAPPPWGQVPRPVLPSLRPCPGLQSPVASVLGRVEGVALETLVEVSSCDERRSCLGRPRPPCWRHWAAGKSPSLVTSTHCPRRGAGRAPALSKSLLALPPLLPAQRPGIRGPPEWTRPPPIICWKVQRRRGGRSPRMAPGPSGLGRPTSEPLPQRGHSLIPVLSPSFVFGNDVL